MAPLTLALLAAAGTVGAQTVTPPSVGSGTVTTPSVNPGAVTTPAVPGAPAVGGATIMPPGTTSGGATTPSVTPPSATVPNIANLPATNADGSAGAQARIEADGYSNVQGLTHGTDGKWRGQATRGGARVGITVDAEGKVATE
ncbi:hypothetical protein [Bradyrhizobium sp.]|uniref:hypothetical protein n=1 Tax=Bradyrhizobium sp. TaxID=376 RepID=UPI0027330147|nr:hypothetical protein [Bradyrhizobium sp.]